MQPNTVNQGYSDDEMGFNLLTTGSNGANGQQQQQQHISDSETDSNVSVPRYNPGKNSDSDSKPQHQFDNQSDASFGSYTQPQEFNFNEEAELLEKRKILTRLRRYEMRKGIKLDTPVSLHTPIDELRLELEIINKELRMSSAVENSKKMITMCVFGIEIMNNKFDPLDIYLDGWSASVNEDIDSYDEILEELYDKYYNTIDASPEIRLIGGLMMSAIMYNISHKMLTPGNSSFLSKVAKGHQETQINSTMNVSGPSGGMADEILQEDLNALRTMKNGNGKPSLVRFE
jgi:hypothetical protein